MEFNTVNKARTMLFALLVSVSNNALGNNNFFLPGDAFFHTVLTEEKLKALQRESSPQFDYSRNTTGTAGCGYAGYRKLEFTQMPKSLKEHLMTACHQVLKRRALMTAFEGKASSLGSSDPSIGFDIQRDPTAINVMFYNTSFNFTRFRFGLRYNEDWATDVVSFGHHEDHVLLDHFIAEHEAVMVEWRDATKVKALQAVCPKLPTLLPRPKIGSARPEPVRVAKNIRAVVLESPDMSRYFFGSDKCGFYDVTEDGITRYHWVNNEWVVDSDSTAKQKSYGLLGRIASVARESVARCVRANRRNCVERRNLASKPQG